ncbi:MAG TPA: Holliday junction resolvase RuvX [Ktedonobacteraceae bacterium]|nr:Holliday junction resolvase RuvX [Ktedonobacteraceae bacterium]
MPRLMALDVGEVRIGVALSDASGFLASPYTTLRTARDEAETWAKLQQLIEETEAEELIIGLPISLDGVIHAQAERIIAFTERLKTHIPLPVRFWDERFSTVEAERLLAERGEYPRARHQKRDSRGGKGSGGHRRKQRSQQEIDALAAAVILQEYLDQHPQQQATERPTRSGQTEDNGQ